MPKKKSSPPIQQTAVGDGNIQIVGDQNVVNQTIIQKISNFFTVDTEAQRAMRYRRAMLELVKNTWIKGVLENSLYNEVLIEVGMEERSDAVDHPWDMQVEMPDKENRTLPVGSSMMEVFDEMNGSMLILGEPGSGKTTMLLELARDCINRAQQDDNQPIPVVFNLSSWDGKQTIEEWLVVELQTKYNVSLKAAQGWIENDDLQLLLDGLDEVRQENREACVESINNFRQKHGLTVSLAVCSRVADYEALTTKLNLSGAVLLRPLKPEQIEGYFEQIGTELKGVYQLIKNDEMLQELVKQPLMLSIMTLAYQGKSTEKIASDKLDTIETRRKHLFDTYIQKMFARVARTKNELYNPKQTKGWLAFLANVMIEHNQIPLFLENMQLDWFLLKKTPNVNRALYFGVRRWLTKVPNELRILIDGLGIGKIETVDTLSWDWKQAVRGLIGALKYGLAIGIFFGIGETLLGSDLGLVSLDGLVDATTKYSLIFELAGKLITGMVDGFYFGLFLWAIFGPIGFLVKGLKREPISQTSYPGQRLSLTKKNSITGSLIMGGMFGLLIGLSGWLLDFGIFIGFLFGFVVFGFLGWSLFGGNTIIRHYSLRRVIASRNFLPYRLIPFLDYCVDRIFLRRVGGGYIFIHRLLMEHFAAMYPEENLVE